MRVPVCSFQRWRHRRRGVILRLTVSYERRGRRTWNAIRGDQTWTVTEAQLRQEYELLLPGGEW